MTGDRVALAVLRRLADLRPPGDPLHAFATTVLSGEATLRAAAGHPAFCDALAASLAAAQRADDPSRAGPPPEHAADSGHAGPPPEHARPRQASRPT
jgi:hypothetical protein